ncbi:MAG: AEC family transporter [Chloroflexota bacterium]
MSQLFVIFLNILAPVFGLVLLGYLVGPRLEIDARSISRIAYYLLAPAFLFHVFSDANLELNLAVRMAFYAITVALLTGAVAFVIAKLLKLSSEMISAFVLISVFGNVGNFGFPIIQFKFGDTAIVEASVYFIVLSITGFVVGVAAATWNRDGRLGAITAVFKTPAILAAVPALLVSGADVQIPIFLERAVGLLAGALIPIMLLTLGIQMANIEKIELDRNVIIGSLVRLVAGPALAMLLAAPFVMTGLPRGTGVLQAAMPAAVLASLIALEHNLMPEFVTTSVLVSTVASAFTLTIVLAIV